MLKKLQDFLLDYSIVVFLTIFVNIILRIGEYWYINSVKLEAIPFSVLYSRSINYDTLFIVLFSLVGLIPFGALAFVQLNFTKFLVRFVFLFLQLCWLLLTGYFLINNALLSSAVFEFSLMEIVNIIFSEFSMNRITLLFSGGIILLIFFFLLIKSKKWKHDRSAYWIIGTYVIISIVSVVNRKHTFKPITFFENYNHFLVGNSKPVFLIKTYSENLNFDLLESREEIKKEVLKLNSLYADKHFLSTDFPLINDSEYQNVLQSYFAECNEKPNIVIIVSESLSASFSGSNCATKKSLTPFVDSIIANGLSWTNFFPMLNVLMACYPIY
ncbi:MAG: hypothetical protein N4A35_15540 [Flavobacteriales bacterium]|jgi:hypothetical protein|nr:hypothetical protein [Flavobacteriales bacterium]